MSARCAIATAMEGVHYVLHAPQGDTYADLLFTMIERRAKRPPVTYTTFQARDLGGDTAELFKSAARDAYERFRPQAMLVGASCTAELIQDDPGGLAKALGLPIPVVPLELPSYQKKENWGAAETFYQLVRALRRAERVDRRERAARSRYAPAATSSGRPRSASATATTSTEIPRLLGALGIDVERGRAAAAPRPPTSPGSARPTSTSCSTPRSPAPPRAGWSAASASRCTTTVPIGVGATRDFVAEVAGARRHRPDAGARGRDVAPALVLALGRLDLPHRQARLHLRRRDARHRRRPHRRARSWASRSSASAPTAASSPARCARRRASYGVEALITDDYLEVEASDRRAAARAGARHADGAPHRQAARHPLRGDLGARARAGLPGALLAADGLRGRERAVRHLGPPADDGPGGASARHVPRRFRVPRRAPRPRISAHRRAAAAGRRRPAPSRGLPPGRPTPRRN